MGRTKVKFNINDLFLDGQHTPEQKLSFTRSPLFPIVTTIYNTTDRKTRIGKTVLSDTVSSVTITTEEGFVVGRVRHYPGNGQYDYTATSDGVSDPSSNVLISTTSASYLRAKLSKNSSHVAAAWLRRNAEDARNCITNTIRAVVDSAVDMAYGRSVTERPMIEFDTNIATFLSNVVTGKTTMLQMPADLRQTFEAKYREYEQSSEKFDAAIDKVKSFFDQSKWVLIRNVNGGVILGAISSDGAIAGLDIYRYSDGLPHGETHDFAPQLMKPTWYPSYDAIPEEYRRELDYSMMMLRVHRNSDTPMPDEERKVWMDIGAANWGKILILPR